jgi:hypothetical protein
VERLLQQKNLQQHTRTCGGERYLYVNIVRNQLQEAEFLKIKPKSIKPLSKYVGCKKNYNRKMLLFKYNMYLQ